MRPLTINVTNHQNSTLMNREYHYNPASNITSRHTEKGKVNYRYDSLDRLIEAMPETTLQDIGLPDEGYTYDAIGNRLGSRHQPGAWQYNGQDQLMSWGTGSQAETLTYTATGQLKQT